MLSIAAHSTPTMAKRSLGAREVWVCDANNDCRPQTIVPQGHDLGLAFTIIAMALLVVLYLYIIMTTLYTVGYEMGLHIYG